MPSPEPADSALTRASPSMAPTTITRSTWPSTWSACRSSSSLPFAWYAIISLRLIRDWPASTFSPTASHQATYTGTLIRTPAWLTVPCLDLNLGTIAALLYAALYVLLEPVAGFVLAAFCVGSAAFANHLRMEDPEMTFWVALAVHVVSWIAQFVGHGAFEGRAPALLDNLVQALFLAPMFVWLEVLFKLGYRKELQTRVEKRVRVEIAKFRAESKNGKAH